MAERIVIAGAKIDEPFLFPCVLDKTPCVNGSGVNFDLFDAIMTAIGYKYKLVPAEENESGYRDMNGSWHGLIGQLERGQIDMTASLLPMEPDDSMKNILFSAPATYYLRGFLIQQPDPNEATVSPWFLLTTFTPIVWLCFLTVLIVYVFLIFGARMLSVSKEQRETCQFISDSVVDVVRSPLSQMEPWPYPTPLRLTLNYLNVPIFILMNFYTAYLTGSLMILGQPTDPFTGLNQLARLVHDKKMTLIKFNNNLRHTPNPPLNSIDPEDILTMASTWNPPIVAPSISHAVQMVANNKSLVLRGSFQQLTHASAFSCRTKVIEDGDTVPSWLTFAFRKDDPLQNQVSRALFDSAHIDRFLKSSYKKYLRKRECNDEMTIKPKFFALGLRQLKYGYLLMFYGYLAAIPLFLLEYYSDNISKVMERAFPNLKKVPRLEAPPRRPPRTIKSASFDTGLLFNANNRLSPNPQTRLAHRRISDSSVV